MQLTIRKERVLVTSILVYYLQLKLAEYFSSRENTYIYLNYVLHVFIY